MNISNYLKLNHEIREKIGLISGLVYIFLMCISIPALMYLDPSYSMSYDNFYPLSQLSISKFSKFYYKMILILGGIFAFLFYELAFIPNRFEYRKLTNWNLIISFGRIGVIGQIFSGFYDKTFSLQHSFATSVWATGYVFCLTLICFNLKDQIVINRKYNILIIFGFGITIISMMHVFYFRNSSLEGIWQALILVCVVTWYTLEMILYKWSAVELKFKQK